MGYAAKGKALDNIHRLHLQSRPYGTNHNPQTDKAGPEVRVEYTAPVAGTYKYEVSPADPQIFQYLGA